MGVIKVERFEHTMGAVASDTYSLTNTGLDLSKAFVRNMNSGRKSAGPSNTGSNSNIGWHSVGMTLGANDITFERKVVSGNPRVYGEVWRYEGTPGGEHEFIVRWHGKVTVASGSASASQVVSGIGDLSKCVAFLQGQTSPINSRNDSNRSHCTVKMTATGFDVLRGETGSEIDAFVAIVEFTGSAWSIGYKLKTAVKEVSGNFSGETLLDNYDGTTGNQFLVPDWSKAFIEAHMAGDKVGEHGLSDVLFAIYPDGTNTVGIDPGDGNARNDNEMMIYVIKNDSLNIARNNVQKNIPAGTDNSLSFPSITLTDLEESSLEWYVDTSGTGTAFARGYVGAWLDGLSSIQAYVHRSGNTGRYRYGVIDLSGLTESGGSQTQQIAVGSGLLDSAYVGSSQVSRIYKGANLLLD